MKRFLFTMFAVIMFAIFVPHNAEAKDTYQYKTTTLKVNTWATSKGWGGKSTPTGYKYTYNLFKVTVPKNSYIKIETKVLTEIYIYDELTTRQRPDQIASISDESFLLKDLPQGTYYIGTSSRTKIRFLTVKFKRSGNYCRSKAKKLERGKTEIFSDKDGYNRWYKIVLSKRKAITIYLENLSSGYDFNKWALYNSNGMRIDYKSGHNSAYKMPVLNKGTYYLYIQDPHNAYSDYYSDTAYDVKSISWE